MKIAIVGLGLIGGSFCRALKERTPHTCYGIDRDEETLRLALEAGAIDKIIDPPELSRCDMVILSLHPRAIVTFVEENLPYFSPNTIVFDCCGIKQSVIDQIAPLFAEQGVTFIGAHPMAGREFSGFAHSLPDLFDKASMILTPTPGTPQPALEAIEALLAEIGFPRIVHTTPAVHDATIAFTSQIAHIISNAYVKSPTLQNQSGFSAGSFQDLSRVAKLNEYMWTELFLQNREPLLTELDIFLDNMQAYRDALASQDESTLRALLRDGRERKEACGK